MNIDELVAAELLHTSSEESIRQGLDFVPSAIASFYVRRQYILGILSYILNEATKVNDALNGNEYILVQQILKMILGEKRQGSKFVETVFGSFKIIQQCLDDVAEREKRSLLLGNTITPEFIQLMKLRRDFLYQEHEYLGEILFGLVKCDTITEKQFISLTEQFISMETKNPLIIHLLPALIGYTSLIDPNFTILPEVRHSTTIINNIRKRVTSWLPNVDNDDKAQDPKEQDKSALKSVISLLILTFYNGVCKSDSATNSSIDYSQDILIPAKIAVDCGALEALMSFAAESSSIKDTTPFYDFRGLLQTRVSYFEPPSGSNTKLNLSDHFLDHIATVFSSFSDAFISNFADLLMEMHLTEEDFILSNSEENLELSEIALSANLERFFMIVKYIYANRPQLSSRFFSDPESDSYGFLIWASQSQTPPLVNATFSEMLAALACNSDNSLAVHSLLKDDGLSKGKKNRFSWSYIFNAFQYYIDQLSTPNQKNAFGLDQRGPLDSTTNSLSLVHNINAYNSTPQMPGELEEEAVYIIAGYLSLIKEVALHSDEAKIDLYDDEDLKVMGSLFSFIAFQTPLIGAVLQVIKSFANTDLIQIRRQIWIALDLWVFNTKFADSDGNYTLTPLSPKEQFKSVLRSLPDTLGFIELLQTLMETIKSNTSDNEAQPLQLPFPYQLGSNYRRPSIWPYVEFIITEVFYGSATLEFSFYQRLSIQLPCLKFIKSCLEWFDPTLIQYSSAAGITLDAIIEEKSFANYVREHPCVPAINFLSDNKIYEILFDIASTGIDVLTEANSKDLSECVYSTLSIISDILSRENTFNDIFIPLLKNNNPNSNVVDHSKNQSLSLSLSDMKSSESSNNGDNYSYFTNLGYHGLRSFEDAILFNLPIISHIFLYVALQDTRIVNTCLSIVQTFSKAPQFVSIKRHDSDKLIRRNRLLTSLETVDESIRIKLAFIEQLERSMADPEVDNPEELFQIKLKLLQYIVNNLSSSSTAPISLFLLGFTLQDGTVSLGKEQGEILSPVSLFKSILNVIDSSLSIISDGYSIDNDASQLLSLCTEIILLLCRNPLSSNVVLDHLREFGFFLTFLDREVSVDMSTNWNGSKFTPKNDKFILSDSMKSMISFFQQRSYLLKYFSMELHTSSDKGSLLLTSKYIDSLASLKNNLRAPRVLAFLDCLEFIARENAILPKLTYLNTIDFEYVLRRIESGEEEVDNILDTVIDFRIRELMLTNAISKGSDDEKALQGETIQVKTIIKRYLVQKKFNAVQLDCLHSWVQLVLIIVSDGTMKPHERSNFILETFQLTVPKLIDYPGIDPAYAEELASLCVSLFDLYQHDQEAVMKEAKGTLLKVSYDRLHPLFRASLAAILTPLASPQLRSDLYTLCNKYLKWLLFRGETNTNEAAKQVIPFIRSSGDKLLDVICNDAISGEGSTRIMSLLFLETLSRLSQQAGTNFILDGLLRYNLLLLLVRSIKRTDEAIYSCVDSSVHNLSSSSITHPMSLTSTNKLSLDDILYEVTAFKSIVYLLIRIAQTKVGATQIIQCDFFKILNSLFFISIDPDLGIELSFSESSSSNNERSRLTISLQTYGNSIDSISLYELLIPIFQLITTILLTMGPDNKPVIITIKQFLREIHRLIGSVLKSDVLASKASSKKQRSFGKDINTRLQRNPKLIKSAKSSEGKEIEEDDSQTLVKLIVVLMTLTDYEIAEI